jgi:hypothetical protein
MGVLFPGLFYVVVSFDTIVLASIYGEHIPRKIRQTVKPRLAIQSSGHEFSGRQKIVNSGSQ